MMSATSAKIVVEVFGQTGGADRQLMASGHDRQRRAAAVELVGDRGAERVSVPRSSTRATSAAVPSRPSGIVVRAGANADEHGHRRRRAGFLGQHDDAVGERQTQRIKRHWLPERPKVGSNHPIVRLSAVRYVRAAALT